MAVYSALAYRRAVKAVIWDVSQRQSSSACRLVMSGGVCLVCVQSGYQSLLYGPAQLQSHVAAYRAPVGALPVNSTTNGGHYQWPASPQHHRYTTRSFLLVSLTTNCSLSLTTLSDFSPTFALSVY